MSTVADVLRSKGREIYSINAECSVYEAVEQMVACDVAALVVTDDQSGARRHYFPARLCE